MPTVLRVDGFQIMLYLPPREHAPAHVHVFRGGAELVIALGEGEGRPSITRNCGMRDADMVAAYRIIEAHVDELRAQWRKHHG